MFSQRESLLFRDSITNNYNNSIFLIPTLSCDLSKTFIISPISNFQEDNSLVLLVIDWLILIVPEAYTNLRVLFRKENLISKIQNKVQINIVSELPNPNEWGCSYQPQIFQHALYYLFRAYDSMQSNCNRCFWPIKKKF